MPQIANMTAAGVRYVNRSLAATFMPRMNKSVYSKVCRSYLQRSIYEPFSALGAAPVMRQNNGTMDSNEISSFTYQVPTQLYKYTEEPTRFAMEMDQTGTIGDRVGWAGLRIAQLPDQVFFTKLIIGNQASSASEVGRDGVTYNVTMDGVSFFNAAHAFGPSGRTQSNIVNGNLPATAASVAAQDVGATAQAFQRDMMLIQQRFSGFFDQSGSPMFTDDDLAHKITLYVPPILKAGADLAFRAPGAMIGGSPGNSGTTGSTQFPQNSSIIREVVSSVYLQSMVSTIDGSVLTPTSQTEYYAFITDDRVAAMYWQRFLPLGKATADANSFMASAANVGMPLSVDGAALFATMEIDHNFGALGAQAQESVVFKEKFFVSPRALGNIAYGFPLLCLKIVPVGASS